MNLENGDLRVHYKIPEKISLELDKAIKVALGEFRYYGYRTGFDLEDGVRDLIFRKE